MSPNTWGKGMLRGLLGSPPLRRMARYVSRRIGRDRTRCIEGLPATLSFDTVDALCREHGRGGLKRCAHLHLSGWKSRGTYRLELDTEAGTSWRLIFKDECYQPEVIPALEGLPVSPGPPEAMFYRKQNAFTLDFLPKLFWFCEVDPGSHFQYLLEDLAGRYAILEAGTLPHLRKAVRGLIQIQEVLDRTIVGDDRDCLLRYDRRYSEQLLEYAARSIADYIARTADGKAAALWERWGEVAAVHQREEFYDDDLRVPIHGDFNHSNVHVHRSDETRLKVVDWEWAGIGLPHADLAALVKYARRDEHPELLSVFVAEDRRLDPEQHWRLFRWCQLERRLLDAAFLARQQLISARRVPWLQAEIRRAAGDGLAAVEWLDAAARTRAAA
jgi:aminoglycoside phosphotransferase (APT) family kinase protein